MPPKRKRTEEAAEEIVHPSRQAQVPGAAPKPPKKPRRSEPSVYKKQAHASSVNAIKKKIRDVTRKLERSDSLPANVRAEDERALAAYQQELADAEGEKIRNKMIKKYHMVRFFGRHRNFVLHFLTNIYLERQKATRQLKKLRKQILEADSTDEVEALKAKMYITEVDLNYTQYCPLAEVYISLYPPKGADEEDGEKVEAKPKPPLWAEVEKHMKDGTLNKLRNRQPTVQANISKPIDRRPAKAARTKSLPTIDTTGLNRRERRRKERGINEVKTKNKSLGFTKNQEFGASIAVQRHHTGADQDDDSDGGFFEE
jgi:hypothetical protein